MATSVAAQRRLTGTPIPARAAEVALHAVAGVGLAALTVAVSGTNLVKAVAILIVIIGACWFATTTRPALALAALMLYLGLLDGPLKLATGSQYVTLVRDVLILSLAMGQLVRAIAQRRQLPLPPLGVWVLAFVVLVLAELVNPHDGTLYHSLTGVRQHLEFVPLFFLAYAFVRTKRQLRMFVLLLLFIAVANGAASWIQFHESPAQLASWGPGYAAKVLGTPGSAFQLAGRTFHTSTGQTVTRPFGLGSDSGDGGNLAALAIGALLAFLSLSRRPVHLMIGAIAAVGVIVGVYTSQGRTAIVTSLVVAIAYAVVVAGRKGRIKTLASLGLAAIVAYAVIGVLVSSAGSSTFRYQGLTPAKIFSTTSHARGFSYRDIPTTLVRHPFGDGLGVAGPAGQVVKGGPADVGQIDTENEILFAVAELGIPGLVILMGLPITVLVLAARRLKRERDVETRVLLAAIIAPLAGILAIYFASAATPTTPVGPYLWASAGIAAYWLVARPAASSAAEA